MLSRLALVAISLLGVTATQQSSPSHSRTIHFHSHSIDTRHVTHIMNMHVQQEGKQQFLIQLEDGGMKPVVENILGHSLVHYYPSNAWLTYTTPHTARTISSIPGVAWVGTYEPSYKLHSSVIQSDYAVIPEHITEWEDDDEIQNVNVKQRYSINVHLQPEDTSPSTHHATQSSLVNMAQEWMRAMNVAGDVEVHGQVMITIHLKEEASIHPLSQHIAHHSRVHYIERSYPNMLLNKWARSISQFDMAAPNTTSTAVSGLTGANEIIGITDTGVDFNSCFFFDPNNNVEVTTLFDRTNPNTIQVKAAPHRKIIQYINFAGDAVDDNGHGTHVAGTVAGASLAQGFTPFNGMATGAKLAVFDAGVNSEFVVPRPLDQFMFPWATAVGAAIHVDAWGNSNPAYDSTAREFDTFMFNNPNFLAVIAAGNNGAAGLTSPATSKNGLVVGATVSSKESFVGIFCPPSATNPGGGIKQNSKLCAMAQTITPNSIAPFSSVGLTQDGRIKPDVVAPGMFLASAKHHQQPGQSCTSPPSQVIKASAGTSMAAGVAAGDVALLRQYFRGGFYPSGTPTNPPIQPSAALLKAIIIDGAVPATQIPGKAAPTIQQQGFGRMILSQGVPLWGAPFTLLFKQNANNNGDAAFFTAATANTAQNFVFCALPITPKAPTRLTVTLVWTDAPGTVNAKDVLVNDLDLQLVNGVTMKTSLGNGGPNPDVKNNVEQIIVNDIAQPTTFTAKVVPSRVTVFNAAGQQPYALVVTGNVLAGACNTPTAAPTTTSGTAAPTNVMTAAPAFFTWQLGDFTTCSAVCADPNDPNAINGGTQTRTVTCVSSQAGPVADAICLSIPSLVPKPVTTQACNTQPCTANKYQWTIGTFTTCSLPCADPNNPNGGIQTRTVTCQTVATPTTQSMPVLPSFCADHPMPATQQACNTLPCMSSTGTNMMVPGGGNTDTLFTWRVSAPTACSVVCGGGVALRNVTCFIGEIAVDSVFCATLPMPSTTIACNTQACAAGQSPNGPTTAPTPSQNPPTNAPGSTGAASPNTTLNNPDAMNGGIPTPPPLTGNLPAPVQQAFFWQTFDYGPCSVGCADPVNNPQGGIQTRVVKCRSSLGNFDDDARCAASPKPSTSKACNMDPCPQADDFNLEWVTGIYGQCDPDTAVQTRWVVCKTTNNQYVDFAQCQAHVGPIPATTQPCTVPPDPFNQVTNIFGTPTWTWYAQRFGDCSQWCNGPGTQTRGLHCLAPMGLVATTFSQCQSSAGAGPQPATAQACGAAPCAATPQWYGGDFISCTDPNNPCQGTEQRHVFCIGTDGRKLQDTAQCTAPMIPFTRSPCGACVPAAQTILGLPPGAVIGIAAGVGVIAMLGVGYLALQWRRRVRDQNNKVASRIALSKV